MKKFNALALAGLFAISLAPASAVDYVRSDANADGAVDLSDPVHTLNYLFSGGPAPSCMDAADTNGDGSIDLSDAIMTLQWLTSGIPTPAAPSPSVGFSAYPTSDCAPTPSLIGCASFPPCP